MTAAARLLPRRALTPLALRRAIVAGCAWGIGMGVVLTALKFHASSTVCISDVLIDTTMATLAGIVTIGPIAAFSTTRGP